MKKLDKLRLINWHLFTNTTTNIENLTFLTGANGTGKSTIIDALQIVLLGDTSGRNFNKAANEKTGRTLNGYLRCETGKTANGDTICVRKGNFSSYIACQFLDDKTDKHFTIGIVFDVTGSDSKDQSFFYINGPFPENNFTNADLIDANQVTRPLTIKELSDYCKRSYDKDDYKFFDTNSSYQQFIKELLGNLPDKYFTLFKKAVSFTPISNISQFITEFVCDVDFKIDITPMQKNIEQYKILEIEAKKLEHKIGELEDIKQTFDDFSQLKSMISSFAYMSDRVDFERYSKRVDSIEETIRKYQQRVNEIDIAIKANKSAIDDLKGERENYLAQKLSDKNFSISDRLSSKKAQANNEIILLTKNIEQSFNALSDYAVKYSRVIESFLVKYQSKKLDFFSNNLMDKFDEFINRSEEFLQECKQILNDVDMKDIQEDKVINFQQQMEDYRTFANKIFTLVDQEGSLKNDQLYEIQQNLSKMSSGQKPFPSQYLEVKNEFENELKLRHHDAKVLVYCDLVDVVDKEWTLSLECALLAQKLHVFVNDKYYVEASKLLAKICDDKNFYSIAIVDSEKIIASSVVAREDSVAKLIKTDHAGARAYTDFLLGRIKKCSTFEEAREAGTGLLSNCTGYRNFTSWYLDKRKGERSFLGTKLSADTQYSFKEDSNELNRQISFYSDIATMISNIISLNSLSSYEANKIVDSFSQMTRIEDLKVSLERYSNQMEDNSLNSVNSLTEKIKNIDLDINNLEDKNEVLVSEKGAKLSDISNLNDVELPKIKMLRDAKKEDLLKYDQKLVEEQFEKEYFDAVEQCGFDNLVNEILKRQKVVFSRINTMKSKLLNLRAAYCSKYNLSYDSTKEDSNAEFDTELESLREVLLPKYQQKIIEAHNKAIKEFRDDFIYKLRNSITTVQNQIDELNLALKDCRFGRDSYCFSVTPDKTFIDYYEMIMDDLLLQIGDAADEYFEKYQDKMEELFNMISDSGSSKQDEKEIILNNIAKFTDYRTYLNFDLLVTKGDDGRTTSLAHTFKTTSGGESQTPFYISILASFAQLYRVNQLNNNDTIRLVIFDEAFSKMDGGRIKEACALLKQFGLQAILSTPSEKLRDLVNSVDLILVAIHDENKGVRSYLDVYRDTTKPKEEIKSVFVTQQEHAKDENTVDLDVDIHQEDDEGAHDIEFDESEIENDTQEEYMDEQDFLKVEDLKIEE